MEAESTVVNSDQAAEQPDEVTNEREATKPERSELPPLLVDIDTLSKLLQRSVASLRRDDASGHVPAALRIGGSKRWRYSEILAWVQAGAPERSAWEALRDSGAK